MVEGIIDPMRIKDNHVFVILIRTYFHFYPLTRTGLLLRVLNDDLFSYFSTKTYVVGTQKNRLNETVLLSTLNICLN